MHHRGVSGPPKRLMGEWLPIGFPTDPEAAAAAIVAALETAHVVPVRGSGSFSPALLDRWEAVVRCLGKPFLDGEDSMSWEPTGALWSDIRYDASMSDTYRHSCTAQPLHTDGGFWPDPAELVVFVCEHQAVEGGETTFVDVETIEQVALESDPEIASDLWNLPLPYGRAGVRGRTQPVLTRDDQGVVVNWNYYRVLGELDGDVERFRQRFHSLLESKIVAAGRTMPVRLRPGDALVFADQRILHGRTAFPASTRCIWKCSLNLHRPA